MKHKLQNGMTLVELLVAMVIGLVVTIVVTTLLVSGENHKRTTTSTNDAEQTGSYAFHALDHVLRNAGSGIAESASVTAAGVGTGPPAVGLLGCKLNVTANGVKVLPRAGAFPAPFTALLGNLTVSPVLIASGQSDGGSDVLVVMGGSGAAGGVSRQINGTGGASSIVLQNTVGLNPSDLVLVSQGSNPAITDCMLEEVAGIANPNLTLGGTNYYTTTSASTDLPTLNNTFSYLTPVGNAAANNVQFELFGVGTDDTLYSYDLLQNQLRVQGTGADASQAIADGVIQLRALYGIQATANSAVLSGWVSPTAAYGYDINTVMASAAKMQLIIAVHVALVVRGEYYDKNVVSPATVTIFNGFADAGGNPLAQVINLTTADPNAQHYRYRVFEFTVPLRNMLLLSKG